LNSKIEKNVPQSVLEETMRGQKFKS